jgi:hypothetical protein
VIEKDGIIRSAADAERVARAGQALVHVLCRDVRVLACYSHWRLTSSRAADLITRFERLIYDDLQLPYSWLPHLLASQFAALAVAVHTGAALEHALVTLEPGDEMRALPPGRAPKTTDDHIARDVVWYYRNRIQRPTSSIRALAKTYRQSLDRPISDPRTTIRAGIRRAEQLLAALNS